MCVVWDTYVGYSFVHSFVHDFRPFSRAAGENELLNWDWAWASVFQICFLDVWKSSHVSELSCKFTICVSGRLLMPRCV